MKTDVSSVHGLRGSKPADGVANDHLELTP